jgi:protein TonB
VITQPNWLRQPGAAEMARFYPAQALDADIQGRAVIRCRVTVSGTLTNCVILSETPKGYGFGRSALALAAYFRMTPKTEDGRPVEGGQVDVPIGFKL